MIKTLAAGNNQSMYDLSEEVYGSRDRIVKLCRDNGISDINYVLQGPMVINYDTNFVVNQQNTINVFTDKGYVTGAKVAPQGKNNLITEDGTQYLITEDALQYLVTE